MGSLTKAGSFRSVGAARRLFCIPLAIAVVGMLILGAGSASAKDNGHAFSFEIKPTGTAHFSGFQFCCGGGEAEGSSISGIAVDNSGGASNGDIYAIDGNGYRVEKFDSAGNFILMFGREVNKTKVEASGTEAEKDVCTAVSGNTCQTSTYGQAADQFWSPQYIQVDPTTGDVYVGDSFQRKVHKYDENGHLITSYGTGGVLFGSESTFTSLLGIAVTSTGKLVVRGCQQEYCQSGEQVSLVTYEPNGTLVGVVSTPSTTGEEGGLARSEAGPGFIYYRGSYETTKYGLRRGSSANGSGEVNWMISPYETPFNGFKGYMGGVTTDSAGTVYVGMQSVEYPGAGRVYEWKVNGSGQPLDAEGNACPTTLTSTGPGCPPTHEFGKTVLDTGPRGIAVNNSNGTLYVSKSEARAIEVFIEAPEALAETESSSWVSTVEGTAKPDGAGKITECKFEFGPTTSYGSSQPCSAPTPYTAETAVSAELPGLNGDGQHTYHYRLVVKNEAGAVTFGQDQSFVPSYVKGLTTLSPPENITRTQATLKGSYEDTGKTTEYHFEWGASACPCSNQSTEEVALSTNLNALANKDGILAHLKPQTVYHYRVVAKNEFGTSLGADKTFETLPAVQTLTTETANPVERRKATAKGSFQGDGTATTYTFDWGTTASYGHTLTAAGPISPAGLEHVSMVIDGCEGGPADPKGCLEPSFSNKANPALKTYHYRISATNELGTTKGVDKSFTTLPAVASLEPKPATSIDQENITLNGKFAGNGEDTKYFFEYGLTSSYGKTTEEADAGEPAGAKDVSSEITDYEAYETYHYRVVAKNAYGTTYSADSTFQAEPALTPAVKDTQLSNLTPTSATLEAMVNPNRWLTVYAFEYGTTEAYGESTEISHAIGADKTFHPVSAQISGLVPGLEYHYRVVAINFTGPTHGPDMTFTTPDVPRIGAVSSSGIGQTTAHLVGSVDPKLSPTNVKFEYGITGAYGKQTTPVSINGEGGEKQSSADLTGLEPGTTYHFRVVAGNEWGTTTGTDQTFTTQSATPPPEEHPEEVKCRKGFVKRHGVCRKRRHHRHHKKHHRHGKRHG